MDKLISCVIPCYNQGKYLEKALESLKSQTYPHFEVIIVEDGSTDNSAEIVKRLETKYCPDLDIDVYNTPDLGSVGARLHGISQSHGDYYVPLDADDFLREDYFEKMIIAIDDTEDMFVYCDTIYVNEYNQFFSKEQRFIQPEYSFFNLLQANFISYCSMFRMEHIKNEKTSYNPNNWGFYEDYEMYLRMGMHGIYGKHIAEPLFYHTIHESSLSTRTLEDHVIRCKFAVWYHQMYPGNTVEYAKSVVDKYPQDILSKKPPKKEWTKK